MDSQEWAFDIESREMTPEKFEKAEWVLDIGAAAKEPSGGATASYRTNGVGGELIEQCWIT